MSKTHYAVKTVQFMSSKVVHLRKVALASIITCVSITLSYAASAAEPLRVVLVDKKKNQLHSALYDSGEIRITKTYHTTLGKVVGDKIMVDDKKTPEGVYFLLFKRTPPQLLKKFGVMAFPVDYPNHIDKMQKKTGFGIMLHATDDPSRLSLDYDSDGCVVVDNHEIAEISKDFKFQLSPMIIYEELKPEFLKEGYRASLNNTVQAWLTAWHSKDIETYIGQYAENFSINGMNIKAYKQYKSSLNKKYHTIDVKASNFRYYYHPKYDVVTFTQDYSSYDKNGRPYFKSMGTKILYVTHNEGGSKILFEDYVRAHE